MEFSISGFSYESLAKGIPVKSCGLLSGQIPFLELLFDPDTFLITKGVNNLKNVVWVKHDCKSQEKTKQKTTCKSWCNGSLKACTQWDEYRVQILRAIFLFCLTSSPTADKRW